MATARVELRPAWSTYTGSFVIGVSCLLLALIPGGAWGVPQVIWALAAAGIIGFSVLSRCSWIFVIDDEHLRLHYGLLSRRRKSVPIRDIRAIELYQPWGDRVFSVGTLAFFTTSGGEADIVFWGIRQPFEWRERIQRLRDDVRGHNRGQETAPS